MGFNGTIAVEPTDSTVNSTSVYTTHMAPSFPLTAGKSYLIWARGIFSQATLGGTVQMRLSSPSGAQIDYAQQRPSTTANVMPLTAFGIYQAPGSTTATIPLDYKLNASAQVTTCTQASVACIELPASWDYATMRAAASLSTVAAAATPDTACSITFAAGTNTRFLIMAKASVFSSTASVGWADLWDGTTSRGAPTSKLYAQAGVQRHWMAFHVATLSGTQTWSLRGASADGSTVQLTDTQLIAIPLANASDLFFAEARSNTTAANSATYADVVSLTATAAATPHWVFGSAVQETSSTTSSTVLLAQATAATVQMDPATALHAAASGQGVLTLVGGVETPSAGSRTWALQKASNGTINTFAYQAALLAWPLTALVAPPATVAPGLSSATLRTAPASWRLRKSADLWGT